VLELGNALLQAGAFLADRVGGPERVLRPLGLGVQRGDLLVGGTDCGGQPCALSAMRILHAAEPAARRCGQRP
jgi:hypothetical protein